MPYLRLPNVPETPEQADVHIRQLDMIRFLICWGAYEACRDILGPGALLSEAEEAVKRVTMWGSWGKPS